MRPASERPVVFDCAGERLLGILHPAVGSRVLPGVLVIVGGPQYRVGSHRQFVQLARGLAASGFPVFRFDCRGMGDSTGVFPGFEHLEPDVRCAMDEFARQIPNLPGVVIFGLCDAASAALMYCRSDPRVRGLILANPWVRTPSGEARSYVQHYYSQRLLQTAFWRKLLTGRMNVAAAVTDFLRKLWSMRFGAGTRTAPGNESFIDCMRQGLEQFRPPVLMFLSEQDLTAQEFRDLCGADTSWQAALNRPGVTTVNVSGDHTFSSRAAGEQVVNTCASWLQQPGAMTPRSLVAEATGSGPSS